MKQNIFVVVAFAFLIFTGCSRPSSNTTRLTLSVPQTHQFSVSTSSKIDKSKKVSALAATGSLFHLVINVRGAGIQAPISLNFDADKHNGSAPTAIPNTVSIEVPAGSARLIQVMAVYVDPATMIGSFQYGDVTTDLSSGSQSVSINVESLGTGSVKGGKIQGRFMSSTFGTPSGMVETRFQPPQSKPAVVINRSTMVNGWFQAFALPTIPFDVWVDGVSTPLFQNFTLNNVTLSGDHIVRVTLPERVQNYGGGGGSENRESESVVLGFFGDAVPLANKVCIKDSAYVFSKLFQTDGTTPMTVVTSADPSKISIESDGSVTDCSVPDVSSFLTSVIPIDYSLMDNWGGIEAIGSRYGVFAFPVSGGSSPAQMSVDLGLNKFSASFTIMPGVFPLVDTVGIYYRGSNSPRDYEADRDVICQDIANGKYGFRLLTSVTLASGQSDYSISNRARPADLTGSSVAAFCPMKNGRMLGSGFVSDHIEQQNSGGGGGGGGAAVSIGVFKNGSPINFIGAYQCFDFTVQLRNSNGGMASNTSARSIDFVVPVGMTLYPSYNDCTNYSNSLSGSGVYNGSIASGQSDIRYWFRTSSTYGANTVSVNSAGLASGSMNISVISSSYYAHIDMPESLVPGICYPANVRASYDYGGDYNVGGDTVINLSANNANLIFYSNSSCGASTNSVTILNGTSNSAVWVKLTAAVSGDIIVNSSAGGFTSADFRRMTGGGNATPTQLFIGGGNNTFPVNNCSGPYSINVLNANNTPVVATIAKSIGLTGRAGVSFYASNSCNGAITTLPLAIGEYRKMVWIKYSSAGPDNVTASVPGWTSASMNLTINGLHHYNLIADIGNPAHGGCVQLGIDPRNYPSGSGSFNYSEATAFQYQGFPAGTLFKHRLNGECIEPLSGSPVTVSKMANSGAGPFVYYRALNPTGSMLNTMAGNYHIESAGVSGGEPLNINVAVAPAMTLADSASGEVASDYPFFIEDIVNRFTGRPTFLFEANTAGWTTMASTVVPNGIPRDVRATDSTSAQSTYTATGRVSSYTADFTTGTLPTNWSYTSTSGAYGVDGTGYLTWYSSNTPLWDRNPDPASGYVIRGLKVEAGIANLVGAATAASEDFSLWDINPGSNGYAQVSRAQSTETTPDGTTSALKWSLDDYNGGNASNVEHANFAVSVTNGNKYVMSIFMKRNTSRFAAFQFNGYSGSSMSSGVVVDLDTGNFSGLTGPYTPNTNLGVGAEKYRDGWYRVWVKFQAQDPNGYFMIFPAFCSTGAGVLCTSGEISASGSVFVWGAQLEQSETMTSYVPSNANSNTGIRSPSSVAINSSFVSGFTSNQGAIRLETASIEPRANMDLLRIGNSVNNYTIFSANFSAEVSVEVTSASVQRATATNLLPAFGGGPNVVSFSYSNAGSNNLNAGANDLSFASGPNSIWPSVSSLPVQIGGSFTRGAGTASIKKFQYWPNRFGLPGVKSISRP